MRCENPLRRAQNLQLRAERMWRHLDCFVFFGILDVSGISAWVARVWFVLEAQSLYDFMREMRREMWSTQPGCEGQVHQKSMNSKSVKHPCFSKNQSGTCHAQKWLPGLRFLRVFPRWILWGVHPWLRMWTSHGTSVWMTCKSSAPKKTPMTNDLCVPGRRLHHRHRHHQHLHLCQAKWNPCLKGVTWWDLMGGEWRFRSWREGATREGKAMRICRGAKKVGFLIMCVVLVLDVFVWETGQQPHKIVLREVKCRTWKTACCIVRVGPQRTRDKH